MRRSSFLFSNSGRTSSSSITLISVIRRKKSTLFTSSRSPKSSRGDSDSDCESVDSDKSYEYDGKKVRGSELYEIWDKEYKEGKKKFNKKEGKKPIQKKKKASTKMSAWDKFLFTNRTNLPAAKYNEHLQLVGWKLDKPVQFKNNSNEFVYKVIEFGTFDKKPKWVKHGIQEWQDGTYY